jgi:hypothetical protein
MLNARKRLLASSVGAATSPYKTHVFRFLTVSGNMATFIGQTPPTAPGPKRANGGTIFISTNNNNNLKIQV